MTRYFRWGIALFLTLIIFLLLWLIADVPLTKTFFYIVFGGVIVGWMLVLADAVFK